MTGWSVRENSLTHTINLFYYVKHVAVQYFPSDQLGIHHLQWAQYIAEHLNAEVISLETVEAWVETTLTGAHTHRWVSIAMLEWLDRDGGTLRDFFIQQALTQ